MSSTKKQQSSQNYEFVEDYINDCTETDKTNILDVLDKVDVDIDSIGFLIHTMQVFSSNIHIHF